MSELNNPLTREEQYLAGIAGELEAVPEIPITRIEKYLKAIFDNVGNAETAIENTSNSIADEYDSTKTYATGDYVMHDNTLYSCSTAIETAEEWNSEHWTIVTVSDSIPKISPIYSIINLIVGDIADEYDSTLTYSIGDYCIHEYELYKCTTAIETAEEFNSEHWTKTTIMEEISA